VNLRRSALVAIVVSSGILTACGTSPPPAGEFANEMIDTLQVEPAVRACMHQKANSFTIPVAYDFKDLDEVAKAADNLESSANDDAVAVLKLFEQSLASCR
jgi:hypothetical protein